MSDPPVSVLVVASLRDERTSTDELELLVEHLRARPDTTVEVWYLRELDHLPVREGRRVVDRLRTLPGLRVLDAVGAGKVAHAVRGQVLRRWYRQVQPDVVLLDDGLGRRVLDVAAPVPPVVVRHNTELPPFAHLEPPPDRTGDLTVVAAAAAEEYEDVDGVYVQLPWNAGAEAGVPFRSDHERDQARVRFGLPTGVPLVVGWGDDGWLDGPDLFVRALWALEHRHGVVAHGVWFGLSADPREVDRLTTEAARCGLAERFWQRSQVGVDGQTCGDVVLLPYRSPTDPSGLLPVLVSGSAVVTFRSTAPAGLGVFRVDELDVEAAAAAVAEALAADRADRTDLTAHLTPEPLADHLVSLGRGFRARQG